MPVLSTVGCHFRAHGAIATNVFEREVESAGRKVAKGGCE